MDTPKPATRGRGKTSHAAVQLAPTPLEAVKSGAKARGLRVVSWNLKQFRHKGQDVVAVVEVLPTGRPE